MKMNDEYFAHYHWHRQTPRFSEEFIEYAPIGEDGHLWNVRDYESCRRLLEESQAGGTYSDGAPMPAVIGIAKRKVNIIVGNWEELS